MEESARKNHADMDGPEGAARRRAWTSAGSARARSPPAPAAASAAPTPPSSSLLATPWFCRRSETAPGCAPQPWRSKCRGGAVWSASVALGTAVDVTGGPAVQLGLANRNKLRLRAWLSLSAPVCVNGSVNNIEYKHRDFFAAAATPNGSVSLRTGREHSISSAVQAERNTLCAGPLRPSRPSPTAQLRAARPPATARPVPPRPVL